jgi:SPP1 gp7 family putative phage head morphogenesis protein
MPAISRLDPTQTFTIRRQFDADLTRRYAGLRLAAVQLIAGEDALGLDRRADVNLLELNTRWEFRTAKEKLKAFRGWLTAQIDARLLSVDPVTNKPWTAKYVNSAYRQAAGRAYAAVRPDALAPDIKFQAGSKAQFVREAFTAPESIEKLEILATRTFEELKGVTSVMAADMNRVLSDAVAHGRGSRWAAKEISEQTGISRKRAFRISRTEIVHVTAESMLDSLERLGESAVTALVEFTTAGNPCPICAGLSGKIYTIDEAHGIIPQHPNCRCMWVPASREETKRRRRA